jgi:hypothetical protein
MDWREDEEERIGWGLLLGRDIAVDPGYMVR